MSKQAEIDYFGNMTDHARKFVRYKPFSADQRGAYLIDIGQVLSLIDAPPARLLDLGCGSGWTTAMFARSGYDALGVDIAPAAIDLAREAFGDTGARFGVHDFESLPFEDVFDICVIYDCLHHAELEQAVLDGAFRALRQEGEIIIIEPGRGHHKSEASQRALQIHGVTEKDMPPSLTVRLLRKAGFSAIRVFPRSQFQLVEKVGTGPLVRILRPFLGSKIAGLARAIKHTVLVKHNGVVLAKKPSNKTDADDA